LNKQRLIALGAVHVVVPGILPTGCLPLFLSLFADYSTEADFDQYGCLRSYNRVTEHHNSLLRERLETIKRKHTSARIMYADYTQAYYQMVKQPRKFGHYFFLVFYTRSHIYIYI
jgi:phospholipase/lecithinase/hemolysin